MAFLVSLHVFFKTVSAVLFISISINSLKMHRELIVNMAFMWAQPAALVKLHSLCMVV